MYSDSRTHSITTITHSLFSTYHCSCSRPLSTPLKRFACQYSQSSFAQRFYLPVLAKLLRSRVFPCCQCSRSSFAEGHSSLLQDRYALLFSSPSFSAHPLVQLAPLFTCSCFIALNKSSFKKPIFNSSTNLSTPPSVK